MDLKNVNLNLDFNFEEQYSLISVFEAKNSLVELNSNIDDYMRQLISSKIKSFDEVEEFLTESSKQKLDNIFTDELISKWIEGYENKMKYIFGEYSNPEHLNIIGKYTTDKFINELRNKNYKMLCFLIIHMDKININKGNFYGWVNYNESLKILNGFHLNDYISSFDEKLFDWSEHKTFENIFKVPVTIYDLKNINTVKNDNFIIFTNYLPEITFSRENEDKMKVNIKSKSIYESISDTWCLEEVDFIIDSNNSLNNFKKTTSYKKTSTY